MAKFTTTERPSFDDVPHGRRPLGLGALDEHLLAGLLGEAGGLQRHVAALGLAAAPCGLVEVVLADLAADGHGEDDEEDPAEDRRPAVLCTPPADARREVPGLHGRLLRRGSYAVRRSLVVHCTSPLVG
jgi:hypothetical protein